MSAIAPSGRVEQRLAPSITGPLARPLACLMVGTAACWWAAPVTAEAFNMLESRSARQNAAEARPDSGSGDNSDNQYVKGFAYEAVDGYAVVEGDMVMSEVDAQGQLRSQYRQRGLGQSRLFDRWPDGIVPYEILDDLSLRQMTRIDSAIERWNTRTNVRLVERTEANAADFPDYIAFQGGAGCASWVGRQGGAQAVWVAEMCPVGSIVHEIGHAMGLFHEHTRPDRDSFVTVNWDNVREGLEANFRITQAGVQTYGEYDYGSIMHYGERFFTNNGDRTIEAPPGVAIGQREAMSPGDLAAIEEMYGTDLALSISSNPSGRQAEVYIDVTNQGKMGAHTLQLDFELEDRTTWQASGDTRDWNCTADRQELQCTLPLLAANEVTRFSVLTGDLDSSAPIVSARLRSITFDTNETNNSREHALPESTGSASGSSSGRQASNSNMAPDDADSTTGNAAIADEREEREEQEPTIGALQPGSNAFTPIPESAAAAEEPAPPAQQEPATPAVAASSQVTTQRGSVAASTSDSGGGASHPAIALLLTGLIGWRRSGRRQSSPN